MSISNFQSIILQGIPGSLPAPKPYDPAISHAPKRNIGVLTESEKKLAGSGFQNIRVEDFGWRVVPTAMHIPFVVLRLLWSGSWRRNDYWKALLMSLGMGAGMRHVGYYAVSGEKTYL